MFRKKIYITLIAVVIIAGVFFFSFNNTVILTDSKAVNTQKFGLIDGDLSYSHKNVTNMDEIDVEQSKKASHGDSILEFLQSWRPSFSFYYYDSEENGIISSENLIDGLEWMIENGVEYVSISYSGKYESEELKDWINKHSDEITIYASYNNYSNTLDYPAMYKKVIGVGCNVTKKKDVSVRNNRLIVCDGISLFRYQGNSYMAPYIMIKNNLE